MSSFHYQATDADGQPVAGKVDADSVQQADAILQARGLTAHSIIRAMSEAEGPAADVSATRVFGAGQPQSRPSSAGNIEQVVLRSHMATILERGREIVSALRAYAAEMSAGRERRQLLTVCQILERGDSGEGIRALAELPESWIPLLSAATTAGDAGQMVHGFLSESRRSDTLRHQWWLMLAYPVAIFGLTTAVMMALAIFVIPEFEEIFAEFDLELPLITLQLLKISTFLSSWGALILVILLGLSMIMLLNANRWLPSSASAWLTGRFRLPFGRRTSIARFARFTADLLEAGVSIPDALRIAGFTVSRSPMQQAAWRLANDIESTGGFSQRLYQRPLTASIAYALAAELPPESRVRLLREISDSHADRVRIRVSWASGIVEPVAILVVGFTVGCAVIGLFLPLVKLIDGLTM